MGITELKKGAIEFNLSLIMKKILTITTTPQKKNSKTSLNTSLVDQ
jgi:hypothetical protein